MAGGEVFLHAPGTEETKLETFGSETEYLARSKNVPKIAGKRPTLQLPASVAIAQRP
jgi:hypothetical protein